MDYTNFSDMGYAVIGSGTRSARLTFIRREYDRYRSYQEGVFTVLESKKQAEERQGVGKQTDLYCVTQNSITELDTASEGDLVQKLSKIEARERQAREKIMDEWREDSG